MQNKHTNADQHPGSSNSLYSDLLSLSPTPHSLLPTPYSLLPAFDTAVASALLLVPSGPSGTASAQISIGINLGAPPVCRWGYYDYPPYQCAPYGYYGPGYFYNGIFLGVGPWHEWGYNHGWGGHRFGGGGGGHYVANSHGDFSHGQGHPTDRPGGGSPMHAAPQSHGGAAHGAPHGEAPQHMQSHAAPQAHAAPQMHASPHMQPQMHAAPQSHGGGGHAPSGGGGQHGGGEHH